MLTPLATLEALADAIDTGGDVAGAMKTHAVALRKSMADKYQILPPTQPPPYRPPIPADVLRRVTDRVLRQCAGCQSVEHAEQVGICDPCRLAVSSRIGMIVTALALVVCPSCDAHVDVDLWDSLRLLSEGTHAEQRSCTCGETLSVVG